MKKAEIVLDGTYARTDKRGKRRLRTVIAVGPEYVLYSGQAETDNLRYMDERGSPHNSTRASFAAWAQERVS